MANCHVCSSVYLVWYWTVEAFATWYNCTVWLGIKHQVTATSHCMMVHDSYVKATVRVQSLPERLPRSGSQWVLKLFQKTIVPRSRSRWRFKSYPDIFVLVACTTEAFTCQTGSGGGPSWVSMLCEKSAVLQSWSRSWWGFTLRMSEWTSCIFWMARLGYWAWYVSVSSADGVLSLEKKRAMLENKGSYIFPILSLKCLNTSSFCSLLP